MNQGLLLSRNWRDVGGYLVLEFWFATQSQPQCIQIRGERPVFFLSDHDYQQAGNTLRFAVECRKLTLKSYAQESVWGVYFNAWSRHQSAAYELLEQGLFPLEYDIKPPDRFLMERFIRGDATWTGGALDSRGTLRNPDLRPARVELPLKLLSFDIETNAYQNTIISIAAVTPEERAVWVVGHDTNEHFIGVSNERACIEAFLNWVRQVDPDILTGWNCIQFDMWMIQQRCESLGIPFRIGRDNEAVTWREDRDERRYCKVQGRSIMDAMDGIKSAGWHFSSHSLEFVSQQLLGDGKLIGVSHGIDEIISWHREDPSQLAKYNVIDCELVLRILAKTGLVSYLIERARLTGAELDRVGGSVAQFEFLYLPRLHRAGYVAPLQGQREFTFESPGGFVMDSIPGLFEHVLVLDFKSLYPSIIRTFFVDPCALWEAEANPGAPAVPGFDGANFQREASILPGIIESLWRARDEAKAAGDQARSSALKIIMNSCYGVLGSSGCRFFDPRLASSITRRGHEILQESARWIEAQGHRVIYGDTDSVFVELVAEKLDDAVANNLGRALQKGLNDFWQQQLRDRFELPSQLEIEFETHFQRFFMPTIRHQEQGSKKRYAGLVGDKVVFKGLENVRSDWSVLARRVQAELFERVFFDLDWKAWLISLTHDMYTGVFDDELAYRKRLRKPLDAYDKQIPPHVKAARMLSRKPKRGDWIEYRITLSGPEPIGMSTRQMDYDHYLEKQIAPAVDSLLAVFGESLEALVSQQIGLDL
ncbi:DNA polymerase II [uncultured Umboniibacter sp.]|uniref:DNA polymerase II n=1 Tax=uncultured Umboniibacter sp. TaxID=1798917 RepID=UPI0026269D59|nr:DNA polymerase II [uncultured Umboniibacter sp.]